MRIPFTCSLALCACLLGPTAFAQQGGVAGMVVAENGQPVAGARVEVQGEAARSTVSDAAGRFRVAGLSGTSAVLTVRRIGFQALTDTVRVGASDLRFVLTEQATVLSEIVVTGTAGGQTRRELGSTVASVRLADQVGAVAAVSVAEQLNARAPGVNIKAASGLAGADVRIQLRGRTSLTLRTQPIVMVDGVRTAGVSTLNDVDPFQLENVELAMGPAAGTLYGTDASSGVLQLRTKRGRPGPARVGVYTRAGVSYFNDYVKRIPLNHYFDSAGTVQDFSLPQQEKDRGTLLYKTGLNLGYAMDVGGGSDAFQYFGAINASRDGGVVPRDLYRKYGGRLNVTITPNPTWDANAQIGFGLIRTQMPYGFYTTNAVLSNPSQRNAPSRGFLFGVPNDIASEVTQNSNDIDHLTAGAEIRHRPFSWLSHRLRGGVDISNAKATTLTKRMTPAAAVFYTPAAAAGSMSFTMTDVMSTTLDYSATAIRRLSDEVQITASTGAQYYRSLLQTLNANGRTFPAPSVTTLAGAATTFGTNNYTENITAGVFGQAQVGWRDRLYVTAALRGDGASNFGKAFGLATYPKLSASWVVSEESFFSKIRPINELRLRAAYGAAGQQPVAFAALRTFAPVTGPGGASAVTPNLVGNDSLGPEQARELEAGLDAVLLSQRLRLGFTFYDTRTTKAIIRRDVAPSSGFPAQQYVNGGEVQNVGWEAQSTVTVFGGPKFGWDVSLGLSTNENTVVSLDIPGQRYLQFGVGNRFQPGFPAYGLFARQIISADRGPNNTAINVLCDGGQGDRPGGVGVPCATAPRVYQGRADPKWMGQVSTNVRLWSRLTISGLVDFKAGYIKFVDMLYCGGGLGMGGGCQSRWYPERYSPITVAYNSFNSIDMAAWYTKGDFARLREVSVGYSLPTSWARRLGASSVAVSFAGRNLGTWHAAGKSASSIDPESVTFPEGGAGFALESYPVVPQLRYFTLLVNLRY